MISTVTSECSNIMFQLEDDPSEESAEGVKMSASKDSDYKPIKKCLELKVMI